MFSIASISGRGADFDSIAAFADVLEQLKPSFHAEALKKFQESDFITAEFTNAQLAIKRFVSIQSDKATHSTVLEVRSQIPV